MNTSVQARLSAPMPLRTTRPETMMPTAQLVRMRLQKNATSARPRPNRLKLKNTAATTAPPRARGGEPDQAHDHQRQQELERRQRAHHQVAEIARPHLLEKRHREAELATEQDVPQDDRADQRAAGLGKE